MSGVNDLKLSQHSVDSMDNNVYILTCPSTHEIIIDDAANDAARIWEAVAGTNVRYILQTHGHSDHVQELPHLDEWIARGW